MAIDFENVRAVVLKPSTSTGPGETTGNVRAATTRIAHAYRFHQVQGEIQSVPPVLGNTQDAHMYSISGPAQDAVDAIGRVDTAMTQLDVINTAYRQTLSTFSTVVNGITMVCHPNGRRPSLTDDHA